MTPLLPRLINSGKWLPVCFLFAVITMPDTLPDPLPASSNLSFNQCITQLKQKAAEAGLSKKTINILNTATFQPDVIKLEPTPT